MTKDAESRATLLHTGSELCLAIRTKKRRVGGKSVEFVFAQNTRWAEAPSQTRLYKPEARRDHKIAGALQLILKIQRSQEKNMGQVWGGSPRTGDLHKAQGNGSGWRPWFSRPNPKQAKWRTVYREPILTNVSESQAFLSNTPNFRTL